MTRDKTIVLTASLLVAAVLGASLTAGDEPEAGVIFEDRSIPYKGILEKAAESGRPIMIEFYAEWCELCAELESATFADAAVAELTKNFINARFNAERGEGPGLVKRFQVAGLPFILFIDGEGNEIDWIVGCPDKDTFLAAAGQALSGKDTYRDFKDRYEADPLDLDAAVGFARKLEERQDPKDQDQAWAIFESTLEKAREGKKPQAGACLSGVVQKLMQVDGDHEKAVALLEELIADYPDTEGIEDDYFLLAQIHTQIFEDEDKSIEVLAAAAKKFAGTEKADTFNYNLGLSLEEKGEFDAAFEAYDRLMGSVLRKEIIPPATVRILVKKGKKAEAETFLLEWHKQVAGDPVEINAVVWCCHENKILLEKALRWAKELVDSDNEETTAFIDSYAWLLYDSGDPVAAARWEQKAHFAAETDAENEAYAAALKIFREAAEKKDR